MPFVLQTMRMLRAVLHDDTALIGFCGAPFTLASYLIEGGGSKNYATTKAMLYSEPAMLHALLAKLTDTVAKYAAAQVAAGAQAVQVFDTWAGELAPDAYARFALPYQKAVIEHIKAAGRSRDALRERLRRRARTFDARPRRRAQRGLAYRPGDSARRASECSARCKVTWIQRCFWRLRMPFAKRPTSRCGLRVQRVTSSTSAMEFCLQRRSIARKHSSMRRRLSAHTRDGWFAKPGLSSHKSADLTTWMRSVRTFAVFFPTQTSFVCPRG